MVGGREVKGVNYPRKAQIASRDLRKHIYLVARWPMWWEMDVRPKVGSRKPQHKNKILDYYPFLFERKYHVRSLRTNTARKRA